MNNNIQRKIEDILRHLPDKPGVYQFFDALGNLLYVGKAKKLTNRVRSYFSNDHIGKTKVLVAKVADIRITTVDSEQDALLLENNLIKEHQPPYNIRLKDDKTYPWICITDERFPRLLKVRNRNQFQGEYFGPYPNARFVNVLVDMLIKKFKIRTCNYSLSEENVKSGKFKTCLEFQLGNCNAPCIGNENIDHYMEGVGMIKKVLKGNVNDVLEYLVNKQQKFIDDLDFESAHKLQLTIDDLSDFKGKSMVVSSSVTKFDVLGLSEINDKYYYSFLRIVNGSIISSISGEVKDPLLIDGKLEIDEVINQVNASYGDLGFTTLLGDTQRAKLNMGMRKVQFVQRGEKSELTNIAQRNAFLYGKSKQREVFVVDDVTYQGLKELKSILKLRDIPRIIECFDNSNIQGTSPASACVVFVDGKPSKQDYRHFGIKTVKGPDDFASMHEAVYRRYSGLLERGERLPGLILIDGGKGQLSSAVDALRRLELSIPVIGIAKRLEEIFVPGVKDPIIFSKRSRALQILQHLRNEAHRFSLRLHRSKRSKDFIRSELEDISGIGKKTKIELLNHFGSIAKIRSADMSTLENVVSRKRAEIVYKYFNH